ncbi:MAG TPA: response regulator [Devosia sp.]|nr:response regulator [Devosia sp.]
MNRALRRIPNRSQGILPMIDLSHLSHVLVVEDEGLIALDIETILREAGAGQVTSLASVEDALLALEESQFDAAVLDLHLGRHGWTYDVASRLREKGVPFILSSGSIEIADDFHDVPLVLKPFSSSDLVAAVARVTSRRAVEAAE